MSTTIDIHTQRLLAVVAKNNCIIMSGTYSNRNSLFIIKHTCGHEREMMYSAIMVDGKCKHCTSKHIVTQLVASKERDKNLRARLHQYGGVVISGVYETNTSIFEIRCNAQGHVSSYKYSVINGRLNTIPNLWCGRCSKEVEMTKRKQGTYKRLLEILNTRNWKLISGTYTSYKCVLTFECDKGHIRDLSAGSILYDDVGCAICNNITRYTLEDCQRIAEERNGKCLSLEYINNHTPMRWICEKGHEWFAILHSITKQNSWCGRCNGNHRTFDDYVEAIGDRAQCLELVKHNDSTRMKCICNTCDYEFLIPFHRLHNELICKRCTGHASVDINRAIAKAEERGGKCLSVSVTSATDKLLWRCGSVLAHEWYATYGNVVYGCSTWCKYCNESKGEREVNTFLVTLQPELPYLREVRIKQLDETCDAIYSALRFDFFIPSLRLFIEFDGEQHYVTRTSHFGGINGFIRRLIRDEHKRDWCIANNYSLVRIKYVVLPNIQHVLATVLLAWLEDPSPYIADPFHAERVELIKAFKQAADTNVEIENDNEPEDDGEACYD